jgi:hypothetical protein
MKAEIPNHPSSIIPAKNAELIQSGINDKIFLESDKKLLELENKYGCRFRQMQ